MIESMQTMIATGTAQRSIAVQQVIMKLHVPMEESTIITQLQRWSECVGHEEYMHVQEYDTMSNRGTSERRR